MKTTIPITLMALLGAFPTKRFILILTLIASPWVSSLAWGDEAPGTEPKALAAAETAVEIAVETTGETAPAILSTLGDDGLHKQPWFLSSFLELSDDLTEAASEGKRFAILWEQKACIYCEQMHTVNFAQPEINDYIRQHFTVLQLNLWGSRPVTDFDGEVLAEKDLARKWGVVFTPTLHFFVEPSGLKSDDSGFLPGNKQWAAVMPGYFRPLHFLSMFEYVAERRYEDLHFQKYIAQKMKETKE